MQRGRKNRRPRPAPDRQRGCSRGPSPSPIGFPLAGMRPGLKGNSGTRESAGRDKMWHWTQLAPGTDPTHQQASERTGPGCGPSLRPQQQHSRRQESPRSRSPRPGLTALQMGAAQTPASSLQRLWGRLVSAAGGARSLLWGCRGHGPEGQGAAGTFFPPRTPASAGCRMGSVSWEKCRRGQGSRVGKNEGAECKPTLPPPLLWGSKGDFSGGGSQAEGGVQAEAPGRQKGAPAVPHSNIKCGIQGEKGKSFLASRPLQAATAPSERGQVGRAGTCQRWPRGPGALDTRGSSNGYQPINKKSALYTSI